MIPVAPFLVDFDARPFVVEAADDAVRDGLGASEEMKWASRVDEAYARGLEEGRLATEIAAEARIEELRAAMERSFALARQAWCDEQGPQLAERITTSIRAMEDRVAQSAASVLQPFLAQAVREQAIGELRTLLQELIKSNPDMTMEISGPEDLLAAVRASLAPSLAAVSYVASEGVDVQVKAGASIIETRIAAWLRASTGHNA